MTELAADVLVVGAGGAGMYAAIAAAAQGARVLLVDKSLVGRGGHDRDGADDGGGRYRAPGTRSLDRSPGRHDCGRQGALVMTG